MSLNASSGVACARAFAGHPKAQEKDIFAAALSEIVGIADRALRASGKAHLSDLDPISVNRANWEMEEWERCVFFFSSPSEAEHDTDTYLWQCLENPSGCVGRAFYFGSTFRTGTALPTLPRTFPQPNPPRSLQYRCH